LAKTKRALAAPGAAKARFVFARARRLYPADPAILPPAPPPAVAPAVPAAPVPALPSEKGKRRKR